MSENINKNSELNEQELEQASGGFAYSNDPYKRATEICFTCKTTGREHRNCPYGPEKLAQYFRDHGFTDDLRPCPFK